MSLIWTLDLDQDEDAKGPGGHRRLRWLCCVSSGPSQPTLDHARGLGQPFCIPAPQVDFLRYGANVQQLGLLSEAPRPGLERQRGAIKGSQRRGCWCHVVHAINPGAEAGASLACWEA